MRSRTRREAPAGAPLAQPQSPARLHSVVDEDHGTPTRYPAADMYAWARRNRRPSLERMLVVEWVKAVVA